ncbi:MAG: hypothetical protein HXS54_07980 [Theionarchaea archaeon]|nr:hypothetical protein [Theionarchaea archaeon]
MEHVIEIQPCRDPVTRMFFGKLGYKVVCLWIFCNVIFILASLYHETFMPFKLAVDVKTISLIEDVNFYIFLVLGICGIILINQFLKSVPTTFAGLWRNQILKSKTRLETPVNEYNRQLREVEVKINSKKSYIFAAAYIVISSVIIFVDLFRIPVEESPIIMYNDIRVYFWSGIASHLAYALLYFVLIIILYKSILLIHFLRKLNKAFDFQVNPLHPDKSGGLKPLGDFCIAINYILFIFFIAIIAFYAFPQSEELSSVMYFGLPSYIFFATFLFVYPLWPVHDSMKEQKYEILGKLKEKLGPDFEEALDVLAERDMYESLKTPRVLKPERIYETANIMWVWPFNVSGLLLFFAAASIPVLSVIAITYGAYNFAKVAVALLIPTFNVVVKVLLGVVPFIDN